MSYMNRACMLDHQHAKCAPVGGLYHRGHITRDTQEVSPES